MVAASLLLLAPSLTLSLPNLGGKSVGLLPSAKEQATVLMFVLSECPLANKVMPEFGRIATKYGARGVRFHLVYVDPKAALGDLRKHASDFKVPGPLYDRDRQIVQKLGVTISPEVRVFRPDGSVAYQGRIDDRFIALGRQKALTRSDLRIALDELLAGQKVSQPKTPSVGCIL
ncbi:MAG: redoxin family protein [Fimbriimonas sp.]